MSRTRWTFALGVVCLLSSSATAAAATVYVPAGGDLQAALNAARPGDTILLAEGAEFVGNFVLPVKTGTGWITVRTSAPDTVLPPAGHRIHPTHARLLARLRSPNSASVLKTAPGAHHWILAYLEFAPNHQGYGDIIQIGDGSSAQNSLDKVPHDFVMHHLYVHGDPAFGQKRGIALNAAHVTIADSYIAECKGVGQDTQAIGGWNGPGPYVIENNYLEGAGENFLLGGADPAITNLVADGVTFRRNYLSRPMSWKNPIIDTPQRVTAVAQTGGSLPAGTYAYRVVARGSVGRGVWGRSTASAEVVVNSPASGAVRVQWDPVAGATEYRVYGRAAGAQNAYWTVTGTQLIDTGAAGTTGDVPAGIGTRWSVKNLFELKNARNVVVEHNVLENHWQESQPGYSIVLTPRNSQGACTWCVVENVRFEYNIVRNVSAGINLLGRDIPERPTRQTSNIVVRHNLFTRMTTALGGNAFFVLVGDGPRNVRIEHNTVDVDSYVGSVVYVYGGTATEPATVLGFQMIANAAKHGSYGLFGSYFAYGNAILAGYFPDAVFTANYLAGGSASRYPAGNLFSGAFSDQFVNPSAGDYTVRDGSPLKGAAPDGSDVGVDFAALRDRLAGVESGITPDGGAPVPPSAEFTTACNYLDCTFSNASVAGTSAITTLTWYFGDATSGTGSVATHVYGAAGTYQVTLSVKDANGLSSTITKPLTVKAGALPPDVRVSALTTASSTSQAGATVQVADTTINVGTGTAAPSRTLFYWSNDALLDAGDILLQGRGIGELAPGGASTTNTLLSLPTAIQPGSYFILSRADGDDVLVESNEANNLSSLAIAIESEPATRPDLLVAALTAPAATGAGLAILVSDTTANVSAGAAASSTTRFFLSADIFLDASDTALQTRSVPALSPDAVSSGATSVRIPVGTRTGIYYLIAQADSGGVLPEANESNNVRWLSLRIGPDVVISTLSAPQRVAADGTLKITETTRNIGGGAAAASTTAFYLSANTSLDPSDEKLEPTRSVPSLSPNGSSIGTTTVTVPSVPAGRWYIVATADDDAAVDEVYEVNNTRFVTVLIGPDLTVASATSPATGSAGTPISVSTTVRNIGTADADASVVRFYLSKNLTLDSTDVQLAAPRPVPALAPGASNTATTIVTLPSATGTYYLLLVADADQTVRESTETNNTVPRALTIVSQ